MRHVVLSGAIATGSRRMVHPTAPAGLIAPPGRALGVAPRRLCTALCAFYGAAKIIANKVNGTVDDVFGIDSAEAIDFRIKDSWFVSM
jgi:hypothetical protein